VQCSRVRAGLQFELDIVSIAIEQHERHRKMFGIICGQGSFKLLQYLNILDVRHCCYTRYLINSKSKDIVFKCMTEIKR
jgi:hypothetical protein